MITTRDNAKIIDDSLLKHMMDAETVRIGFELARCYDKTSICVRPRDLPFAAYVIKETDTKSEDVGRKWNL